MTSHNTHFVAIKYQTKWLCLRQHGQSKLLLKKPSHHRPRAGQLLRLGFLSFSSMALTNCLINLPILHGGSPCSQRSHNCTLQSLPVVTRDGRKIDYAMSSIGPRNPGSRRAPVTGIGYAKRRQPNSFGDGWRGSVLVTGKGVHQRGVTFTTCTQGCSRQFMGQVLFPQARVRLL